MENPIDLGAARRELLAWYDAGRRDLPWRRTRDPYAIWVAEVMLQQTRVETVLPYYARFLARFPDLPALAQAPLDDVLAVWSGLGYYRRARFLHLGAQHVLALHEGRIPPDADAIAAIPGVGPYTTGAIGSQAFDLEVPLVDGNVARVLARLCAIDDDVRRGAGLRKSWSIAGELVRGARPGALNNALMELGAVVCIPRDPRCLICPVRAHCAARSQGRERELPVAARRAIQPRVIQAAAILRVRGHPRGQSVFARCAPDGLFAGLWEPPRVDARDRHEARASLEAMLGCAVELADAPARRVEHVLSHRVLDVTVWEGEVARAPKTVGEVHRARYDAVEVVDRAALKSRGISALARRVVGERRSARAPGGD